MPEEIQSKVLSPSVPECYQWDGYYRVVSPVGQELSAKNIDQIKCPKCGLLKLRPVHYNFMHIVEGDKIVCGACGWACPTSIQPETQGAIADFKAWMEAFVLSGSPVDFVNEDVRVFMYKDPQDFIDNEEDEPMTFTIST